MSLKPLLSTLADGQFHSGDALGDRLNVSRTAIWKQIKKVEALGVSVDSVKGKGYCIRGGLDLLSLEKLDALVTPVARSLISEIDIREVVDSTNAIAMAKAIQGGSGYVCTTEQQTAGKGRRGKAWASPYAANLYISVVWEFSGGAAALEGLSLAVGVAVANALDEADVGGVRLKWPNDILCDGRKLAGILLEIAGDLAGPCQVVVGIGLNVAMPDKVSIDQPWTDIQTINKLAADRNRLLALVLNHLMPLLNDFESKGFTAYREAWMSLDAYADQDIALILGDEVVVGSSAGVDESGAVLVDTPAGRRRFSGGEVSLRPRETL